MHSLCLTTLHSTLTTCNLNSTHCNVGVTKHYWRCEFCDYILGGKSFQNAKARIHLSGDPALRNGSIATVCSMAPTKVKAQFAALVHAKREQAQQANEKKKRKGEMLQQPSVFKKQAKLRLGNTMVCTDLVDESWATAFFGLDIPANKLAHPLFKEAVAATKRSAPGY